ncbi:hypothetical protein NZNM25_11180 [Nitrosopumilus zosterae]|uniref:Uncharacterized protein n=2 Tax=Nitrosopumilus zosterae TaxID=718286 RepID=A0A2S2KRY1_9ARCH|nr:hypothetical protein NZNM25_11180 [Nitrosopumilus zosterae]
MVTLLENDDYSYTISIMFSLMASILVLAIGIGITVALVGSVMFQILIPLNEDVLSPLEEKCQQIANEGYKIHSLYPDSNPEDLLESDMKRLMYLDDVWIKECVSVLPADSIFNIVNNVDRNFSYGE